MFNHLVKHLTSLHNQHFYFINRCNSLMELLKNNFTRYLGIKETDLFPEMDKPKIKDGKATCELMLKVHYKTDKKDHDLYIHYIFNIEESNPTKLILGDKDFTIPELDPGDQEFDDKLTEISKYMIEYIMNQKIMPNTLPGHHLWIGN